MENLIYILIGIAWVAYSLYSARQKAIQKQQGTGMPPTGPSESSPLPIPRNQGEGKSLFDEILRELTGESRPVPQVSRPVVTPVPASYQKSNAEYEVSKESTRYTPVSNLQPDYPRNKSEDIVKTQITASQIKSDESTESRFNLREAVIYSELLNRKYF